MTYHNTKFHFGNNREVAIQRDGAKCVQCGMSREQHQKTFGRDITVDHIDGLGRNTPPELKNNALENLQTLCLVCHGKKDYVRIRHRGRKPKLTTDDISKIEQLLERGTLQKDIALRFGVTAPTIHNIKYKHIQAYK